MSRRFVGDIERRRVGESDLGTALLSSNVKSSLRSRSNGRRVRLDTHLLEECNNAVLNFGTLASGRVGVDTCRGDGRGLSQLLLNRSRRREFDNRLGSWQINARLLAIVVEERRHIR